MADQARVELHPEAIAAIAASADMRRLVLEVAEPVVVDAALAAPKKTGAGAGSISAQAELFEGAWVADASWDKRHYYLGFQDMGTRFLPAKRFLEIALDQHAHL